VRSIGSEPAGQPGDKRSVLAAGGDGHQLRNWIDQVPLDCSRNSLGFPCHCKRLQFVDRIAVIHSGTGNLDLRHTISTRFFTM
jgi:hypothetical protein